MTTALAEFKRARRERLLNELPRHIAGACIAAGAGFLAFTLALWCSNPGPEAMTFGASADLPAFFDGR